MVGNSFRFLTGEDFLRNLQGIFLGLYITVSETAVSGTDQDIKIAVSGWIGPVQAPLAFAVFILKELDFQFTFLAG